MQYIRMADRAGAAARSDRTSQTLLDRESGATSCSVTYISTPPGGGSPAGLHTHTVDQVFYVLEGVMSIEVAGTEHEAGPGTLVVFPAGVAHRNWNGGTQPTVHLAIASPLPAAGVPFATPVEEPTAQAAPISNSPS